MYIVNVGVYKPSLLFMKVVLGNFPGDPPPDSHVSHINNNYYERELPKGERQNSYATEQQ